MFEEYDLPDSGVFRGFEPDTFAFLANLRDNNTLEWMTANEDRYRRVLRESLRMLFKALAPVVSRLDTRFETDAKYGRLLASIRRRWPDEHGTYHTYLWGAFYRADRSRQTDAQLFVTVREEVITVGVGIGAGAQDVLAQFRANLTAQPDHFLQLIKAALDEGFVVVISTPEGASADVQPVILTSLETSEDLAALMEVNTISIERSYPSSDDLVYQPEFADEISGIFERLYPLYRFFAFEFGPPEPVRRISHPYSFEQLQTDTLLSRDVLERMIGLLKDKGQIILYGPPGTGKTYVARHLAHFVTASKGDMQVVQFHPSYAYEEFIEGIRPHSDNGQISYPIETGVFRRLCDDARQHMDRAYVLIIDEINRGNLPRIFGELLYLLDYRDPTEAVMLPYSKTLFTIPTNVYLIGTMNTADRTLAVLDHAVRRRFHFIPLRADPDVLRAWLTAHDKISLLWVADLMTELNRRLEEDGIDWQLHIGQTLFMLRDLDERRVELIWEHSVLPTLEEYFYNRTGWQPRYAYEALRTVVRAAHG
jgi:5-methylcytosine-specific restriction enzyme B